jgi:predicted chitinase
MRASEISPKKLVIFDIDDTLVKTDTKVNVIKDGKVIKRLNSHDFTHYKLEPGETFDFGAFKDAREFFEKAKPIIPMIGQLKRDIDTGNKVIMVTAREDFNDREIFLDTFRRFGIDMSKVHVYRAGNIKGMPTEEKKKIIINKVLDSDNYTKAIMYDDAKPNLDLFLSLGETHPNTKFYAWYVDPEGNALEYGRSMEEDISRRGFLQGAGAAAGLGAAGYAGLKSTEKDSTTQTIAQPEKQKEFTPISDNPKNELYLLKTAKSQGLKGPELAQFMGQMKHESWDFSRMHEKPQPGIHNYYAKKYDIRYAPKTAKILGNKVPGDGAKYYGRGYVQLTGRDNYKRAGEALGIDLLKDPDLASRPDIASLIAVWYWNNRVKPFINDFNNTKDVTQKINPAIKGLENRHENYKTYLSQI